MGFVLAAALSHVLATCNACFIGCRFPEGMEEELIATIAKDVLQGLEYMHDDGSMHRRVSKFIIACTCLFPCA